MLTHLYRHKLPTVFSALSFTVVLAAAMATGCGVDAPGVCCENGTDCALIGLDEPRPCPGGDICVNNACTPFIPTCSFDVDCTDSALPYCIAQTCEACKVDDADESLGCSAELAVCDTESSTCTGCEVRSDCDAYIDTPACGAAGACVQCENNADCTNPTPICGEAGECAGCTADEDCESNFCDDSTGACVAEADVIYMDPTADESLYSCSKAQPCLSFLHARSVMTATRRFIKMAPAIFTDRLWFSPRSGTIPVVVHGQAASLQNIANGTMPINFQSLLNVNGENVTVVGLRMCSTNSGDGLHVLAINSTLALRDVRISNLCVGSGSPTLRQAGIVLSNTTATLHNVQMDRYQNQDAVLVKTGSVADISGLKVYLGGIGVHVEDTARATIINSEFRQTTGPGVMRDGTAATAKVSFSSFYNTGTGLLVTDNSARGIACINGTGFAASNLQSDNIIWAFSGNPAIPMVTPNPSPTMPGRCPIIRSILGETTVAPEAGNLQADPLYIDYLANFRLQPGSPAIDFIPAAMCTATVDADGNPRPQGAGCEPGAYEFVP